MTSTTTKTSTAASKASAAKLQADIDAAETAHTAALADIPTAEAGVAAAKAEAARIDGLIVDGDLTYGQPDSLNASEAARFAGLILQREQKSAAKAATALGDAKLALLIHDIENDGRIIQGSDSIDTEGLALAKQIAPLVKAFHAKHEEHNLARLEAIERAAETTAFDGINGFGDSSSRLTFGKYSTSWGEGRPRREQLILDGREIPVAPEAFVVDELLKAIKVLAEYTPEDLAAYPSHVPFTPEYAVAPYSDPRS